MPLVAARPDPAADLDALLAAGWHVEVTPDGVGTTVTVSLLRRVSFTAATAAEALAAARVYGDVT